MFWYFRDYMNHTDRCTSSGTVLGDYNCAHCDIPLKSSVSLRYHMMLHSKSPRDKLITCQVCDKVFKTTTAFKSHTRLYHRDSHDCVQCDKIFPSNLSLRNHIKAAHTGEKPACPLCKKQFDKMNSLRNHRRQNHCPGVLCECTCSLCGRKFSYKSALVRHMKKVHADPANQEQEANFVCEICGKGLKNRYTLDYHMSTHTGEKPQKLHACTLCDKAGMRILREFAEFRGILLNLAQIRIHILIDLFLSFL